LFLAIIIWALPVSLMALVLQEPIESSPGPDLPGVVSLDFCADQYVLALAKAEQILALSPESKSVYAAAREKAKHISQINPRLEDILYQHPQLVVRQWGGAPQLQERLKKHNIEVVQLGYVAGFSDIVDNIKTLAARLQTPPSAMEMLIANLVADDNLEARDIDVKNNDERPRALYVTPGGVTAGQGTLIDEIIERAGLMNMARESGKAGWFSLPLETLLASPPDIVITGFFDTLSEQANAWSAARHPVYERIFQKVKTINLPLDIISCGAPSSYEAVYFIRSQRKLWEDK